MTAPTATTRRGCAVPFATCSITRTVEETPHGNDGCSQGRTQPRTGEQDVCPQGRTRDRTAVRGRVAPGGRAQRQRGGTGHRFGRAAAAQGDRGELRARV